MKRIILTSILLLLSLSLFAQGFSVFNYYRIESKVDKTYSAIETNGRVLFSTNAVILKANNDLEDLTFIITEKLAESEGKVVYMTYPSDARDTDVVIEKGAKTVILIDMSTGDGLMFLNEVMKEERNPLPEKDVWFKKVRNHGRKENRKI